MVNRSKATTERQKNEGWRKFLLGLCNLFRVPITPLQTSSGTLEQPWLA